VQEVDPKVSCGDETFSIRIKGTGEKRSFSIKGGHVLGCLNTPDFESLIIGARDDKVSISTDSTATHPTSVALECEM